MLGVLGVLGVFGLVSGTQFVTASRTVRSLWHELTDDEMEVAHYVITSASHTCSFITHTCSRNALCGKMKLES